MSNKKFYGTESDVMFKCLFGAEENENITKDFYHIYAEPMLQI